jgi:hypothetical protein
MNDVFLLRIIYRDAVSLHKITSTVESVNGAKIKRLDFRSKGKIFVGIIAFEVSRLIDFEHIMLLIRRNRDISRVERVADMDLCY